MQAFALTEIGKVRKDNEDSYMMSLERGLFSVADGMGGYAGGQVASSIAISVLDQELPSQAVGADSSGNFGEALLAALHKANKIILAQGQEEEYLGMGTTVTTALIADGRLWIAHIGDSRAYLCRAGQVRQLTQDHSLVNELVQQGELTLEEAQNHPRRHVLTRALGVNEQPEIDLMQLPVQEGDLLLLCTDGLYNQLKAGELEQILAQQEDSLQVKVENLVNLALERGGHDNITAILVRCDCLDNSSLNNCAGKR
jgi:serine/threonine protein phosphatase PrpC